MADSEILISSSALTSFSQEILQAAGVAEPRARLVATSLVSANLRGVDSHGVQLLLLHSADRARPRDAGGRWSYHFGEWRLHSL